MPPKSKFKKEEIINAALDITRIDGLKAVTARALGDKLGTSPKPIFGLFENMDEVQDEVIKATRGIYDRYVEEGLNNEDMPAFKGVGMKYIEFAISEPKLFQLLFMQEQPEKPNLTNVLPIIDDNYDKILKSVKDEYRLSKKLSERLYRHLWIYTHGIAVLCATNMCTFTAKEMSNMLTEVHISVLNKIKGEAK
ncbi:MAG: TetR/AcrR family transcriptional regulator [Lachnospiraceae bacterium]|nr:TetR/AcrR family transcriptional regulator [Lachnospiraceae bacterium]